MARLTVEDCLPFVDNRFELILKTAKRARQLMQGATPQVNWENDKATVLALREIAAGHTIVFDEKIEDEPDACAIAEAAFKPRSFDAMSSLEEEDDSTEEDGYVEGDIFSEYSDDIEQDNPDKTVETHATDAPKVTTQEKNSSDRHIADDRTQPSEKSMPIDDNVTQHEDTDTIHHHDINALFNSHPK